MSGTLILVTILAYFGLLLLIAEFTARRVDNDAFFRGNRESPWYIVSFGMIGASLSGVTFVSVPGMVMSFDMTYMQTCIGFFFGYLVIAHVLLPLYYRLNLTSIYTYLGQRLGNYSYKTGASFFLLSKLLGAAVRLYLVCMILQRFVFDGMGVPFVVTVVGAVLLIWLYTRRSGIRTIVWTDSLQTLCMLVSMGLILWKVVDALDMRWTELWSAVRDSGYSRVFVWDDWVSRQNFFKQFFSGIFITIVMSGLDQDMMQKNLSCRNLRDARKNIYCYGFSFIPVNLLLLTLGVMLVMAAGQMQLPAVQKGDELLPIFAAGGYLGYPVVVFFTVGIIAAAFSSADSALAALTTSCCIDLLEVGKMNPDKAVKVRKWVHLLISVLFIGCIVLLEELNSPSIIDTLYVLTSYTYGPLLGLFSFSLLTRHRVRDCWVPWIAVASPVLCYALNQLVTAYTDYRFGYEMLMLNGLLVFIGLRLLAVGKVGREGNDGAALRSVND